MWSLASPLTTGCIAQVLAGLGHLRWIELDNLAAEGVAGDGVDVIETDETVAGNSVVAYCQLQF